MTECECELCTTSAMLRTHNPPHGKASTYRRYACRCEACTRAASEAQKRTRANRMAHQPSERVCSHHESFGSCPVFGCPHHQPSDPSSESKQQ